MSLDVLRRDAIAGRQNELTERLRSLRRSKRQIRSVTNLISRNANLSSLVNARFDTENSPPPDSDEISWLKSNDISNGHYFDEASIPPPPITSDVDTISISQPNRLSSEPVEPIQALPSVDLPGTDGSLVNSSSSLASTQWYPKLDAQSTKLSSRYTEDDEFKTPTYEQRASEQPEGPIASLDEIAPPEPEEEADLSEDAKQLLDLSSPERPTRSLQFSNDDVPDGHLEETAEKGTDKADDADHVRTTRSQAELASSPSSTAGAYSAATPLPAQDSPDTSPDSENGEQIHVLPPKDLQPSPEEQREKDEHDRYLAAQKEIAKRNAMGDVSNPDDQLRWEECEAAAREAEETAARLDVNGPEPDVKGLSEGTKANEVMEGIEKDDGEDQVRQYAAIRNVDSAANISIDETRVEPPAAQEDGDNITVATRHRALLTIDTGKAQTSVSETTGQAASGDQEQERMTTRTSSGVLHKRRVSELLGQTPLSSIRREVMSPEEISSSTARHMQETPIAGPSTSFLQTLRRSIRSPVTSRTPSNAQSALDDLSALKGAAEDPDRDYLEPLFRIQAHDSPNVPTAPLPDLVRSASKTLTTDDHFTTLHERLDYRILRRIYQLQNANKWSLRQMDKCKEPEQPVTHQDHMMAEMQWMRKDFRAERKMKKHVCAWLAQRCSDWVNASAEVRKTMQTVIKSPKHLEKDPQGVDEEIPELEHSGESAPEDDATPLTPTLEATFTSTLIVPPELSATVSSLHDAGKLQKALSELPVTGLSEVTAIRIKPPALNPASKFTECKVLPRTQGPKRKRSRYDYEDDTDLLDGEPESKRLHEERDLDPETQEISLFHPENKHIRDRLHANNAFRPPSEFVMPSTSFYEFRNGSQWIWEDDMKLRKLAKEYSFNWSLIADELQLPSGFKSSAERRTPWECFERWVELEQLPAEMKKTMYFKTWYQRLEQSQQAAERRYQAQVAALQAANNGQANHVPMRRRTIPTRVEKRKNTRYLWLVDAMRKLARKKEQHAYKQAEAQRAAAGRKIQDNSNQPRAPMLTPQEFSKKRHERDLQIQEAQRQHRQKMIDAQRAQIMAHRAAQQQQQGGVLNGANPQRPGSSSNMPAQQAQMQPNGQQPANANGQIPQQGRQQLPMATRNGHLAVPQVNAQGIPQAQMRPNGQVPTPQEMQRIAQANAQARTQYQQQQQYQMQNANMSPGQSGMTPQQQLQSSQAMLSNMHQQMNNASHQGSQQSGGNHQMSASPSMPPPPTPQALPQSLSSGHVPALLNIKSQIRARFPHYSDEEVNAAATDLLKSQSQTTNQARQTAMNAAAGINGVPQQSQGNNMQAYGQNQAAYQNNQQMANGSHYGHQQQRISPQQYNAMIHARQMSQMQGSPSATHATLNGSPSLAHASPSMAPVSPNMQYSNMNHNQMASMNMARMNGQQRPPSRGATPQMQRLGSSGSVPQMGGLPSPQGVNGLQGSPRNMQANMAR